MIKKRIKGIAVYYFRISILTLKFKFRKNIFSRLKFFITKMLRFFTDTNILPAFTSTFQLQTFFKIIRKTTT